MSRSPDAAPSSSPPLTPPALRAAVLDHSLFPASDPSIRNSIIHAIVQYLQDEGYTTSSMVLQDETRVKLRNVSSKRSQLKRMKRAILDGQWADVHRLLLRTTFRNLKPFKYALYRQQFLELIHAQQHQPAFLLLQRHLKNLEAYAKTTHEFRDLCYLLTCKSVTDAPSFRHWDGVHASRAALLDQYSRLLHIDTHAINPNPNPLIPPNRLVHLLQQSLAFQISSARHMPRVIPRVSTLLNDFEGVLVPNTPLLHLPAHTGGNVKCVAFVGEEGSVLASGGADNIVRLWNIRSVHRRFADCTAALHGHTGRVWQLSATLNGNLLASGAADGVVRIWDTSSAQAQAMMESDGPIEQPNVDCLAELTAHQSDVYAVSFHSQGDAVASAGYDRCVRLWDVRTQQVVNTFSGHKSSVSCAVFNSRGNMIITAGKDCTIKFWDLISGLCVKTISSHLGEVTSIATNGGGDLLVSCSKDNSNRVWDMRMNKAIRRFKGHQNTSKNFIRAVFGPSENVVVGGSEDGLAYVWDVETTDVVTTLGGGGSGGGVVYDVAWNSRQSLLACSGQDGVGIWGYCEEPVQEHDA